MVIEERADQTGRPVVEQHGIDIIPDSERHGTPRRLGLLWTGAILNVQMVTYGALLVYLGLNLWQALVAIALGSLAWIFPALASLVGPATGTTTFRAARAPFGVIGARVITFCNFLMQLGYHMLALVLSLLAVKALVGLLGVTIAPPAEIVLILCFAALQAGLPILGYDAISRALNALVIPFAVLFVALAWLAGGQFHIAVAAPAPWQVFLAGIALSLSAGGLGWSSNAADFSRYLPRSTKPSRIVRAILVGGGVPQLLLLAMGVVIGNVAPNATDPIAGIAETLPHWFVAVYLVFVLVQTTTASSLSIYSCGVMMQAMGVRLRRWQAVVVESVLATVLACVVAFSAGFNEMVSLFLQSMMVWLAPWVAITLLDYLRRRADYSVSALSDRGPAWRTAGVTAQGIGMLVAFLALHIGNYTGPLSALVGGVDLSIVAGLVVAAIVFLLMTRRASSVEGPALPTAHLEHQGAHNA